MLAVRQFLSVVVLGVALVSRSAQAEPHPDAARLEQAKIVFRKGLARLKANDIPGALQDFSASRELLPNGKNTVNTAICLERVGRYDEALQLYEEVFAKFATDLEPEDRDNLLPVMAFLRQRLSYLELSGADGGEVVVADHPRGRLPFEAPLPVVPGERTIRVTKDGYRPFESSLLLIVGQTHRLVAELQPLRPTVTAAPPMGPERPTEPARASNLRGTLGWTLTGAGGLQLAVAGYFGVRAIQWHGDGRDVEAGQVADVSTVLALTGVATSAVGVYLLLTREKPAPATVGAARISLALGPDKLVLVGGF